MPDEIHAGHGPICEGIAGPWSELGDEPIVLLFHVTRWLVPERELPKGEASYVVHRGAERIVVRGAMRLVSSSAKGDLRAAEIVGACPGIGEVVLDLRFDGVKKTTTVPPAKGYPHGRR